METWLLLPVLFLLLARLVPDRLANRQGSRTAIVVSWLVGAHVLAAAAVLMTSLRGAALSVRLWSSDAAWGPSLYFDGTAAVMLTLVAFIGWVICRYSIRFLDGESGQGSCSLWLSSTIGAVSLLTVSGDLLTLFFAWSLASLGIHHLLTHYSERPAARTAAWTKCACSRLGDVLLIAAGILIYREFGTLELAGLFTAVSEYGVQGLPDGSLMSSIGALLIAGAAVKTSQFPFHTWLPETLEAPTPVSALMHAGIVNAGGYVLIRLHPLLTWSAGALTVLAVLGAFTACFAATVMLTQTSIKKSLAWSTIAQMGFMMLQCGLGAFSAAMLHIVAHSLYKAHAFLNCGDVLNQAAAIRGATAVKLSRARWEWATFGFCILATQAIYVSVAAMCGFDLASKPGGFVLGMILCLGLARWVWLAGFLKHRFALPGFFVTAVILSLSYVIGFSAIDSVVSTGANALSPQPALAIVAIFTGVAFLSLFVLDGWLSLHPEAAWQTTPRWLQAAYVHAGNGFYVDALLARSMRAVSTREPRPAGESISVTSRVTRKDTV